MINKDIKDITFADLLELQKQLDEEVAKPRPNGFVPRERTLLDIKLALDDEFQEWLRELPQELNFKTWKEKEYKREDELIEITDCLFFFLQLFNRQEIKQEYWFEWCEEEFNEFQKDKNKDYTFSSEVEYFKESLWEEDYHDCFCTWVSICRLRGFTKDEIVNQYLKKWKENISNRIKGEWSNEK